MNKNALILDLDDTIFQTNTIDKKVFESFFDHLLANIKPLYDDFVLKNIMNDLWKDAWDVVINRYDIPEEIFRKSIQLLENLPLQLEIATFRDYQILKEFAIDKYLVTTGLTSLQNAKIKALAIENDFKEIIINDRFIESKTKIDHFRTLISKYKLDPKKTFVIGDNPYSEIYAGNLLGLKTIQILRANVAKGNNANFYITSFEELKSIIKLKHKT